MRTISLMVMLFCAHLAMDTNERRDMSPDKRDASHNEGERANEMARPANETIPLHEHPTLVDMLHENNELRAKYSLEPHRIDEQLTRAAQDHAWYMARTGEFSHYSNRGPTGRAVKYGYTGAIRENIALGQRTVESAFSTWRNSGGHWANITSNTTDAGFGYAISSNGTQYWVAVYGTSSKVEGTTL